MDAILLGLLKSSHKIQIKKAFIDKLIHAGTAPQVDFDLVKFFASIEAIWRMNGQEDDTPNYESFLSHYDLVKSILIYFLECEIKSSSSVSFEIVQDKFQALLSHLIGLIKLTFSPTHSTNVHVIKERCLLMITWLRLINESFRIGLSNLELCANLINVLASTSSYLAQSNTNSVANCFLYMVQTDAQFCDEYLRFLTSFYSLIDKLDNNSIEHANIIKFANNSFHEANSLLIRQVLAKVRLLNSSEFDSPFEQATFKAKLGNICKLIRFLSFSMNKSMLLYELVTVDVINFLCNDFVNEESPRERVDKKFAEIFKCFDLKRTTPIINKFFQEKSLSLKQEEDDVYLKTLLLNMIDLLSWPFPNRLDEWICCFMTILAVKLQKFQILINVCEQKCDYILNLIEFKVGRDSALNILSFFLINYQHSPKLFHKSVPKISSLLALLKPAKKQPGTDDKPIVADEQETSYQQLGLLAFICISKFGGYPQLHKPILDIILDDVNLTGFEAFREKYSLQKISSNLTTISTNETGEIYSNLFDCLASCGSKQVESADIEVLDVIVNKKAGPMLTGLINLGNTCYLNSIIQSLYSCKIFVKSIIELEANKLVGQGSFEFSFLNQLKNVFSVMTLTQRSAIKATHLVKHCTPSWFKFGQQQDSSEYLNFLLDNLDEQLKHVDAEQQAPTLVKRSFGIQLRTKCECSKCSSVTTRDDNCYYLPLSFVTSTDTNKTSLQTMVNNFFEVEQLTAEAGNLYHCSMCGSLQTATKQILFMRDEARSVSTPEYLILTLNRFIYSFSNGLIGTNTKIMDQIDYPAVIEIKTHSGNNQIVFEKYALLAIVVHSGSSLHYGHYYTYMKHFKANEEFEWYLANDSHLSTISFESLFTNQGLFKDDTPYIVFYQRVLNENDSSRCPLTIHISQTLTELIEQDSKLFQLEENLKTQQSVKKAKIADINKNFDVPKDKDDDEGSSYCGNDSQRDSGPRIIF